MKKVIIIEDSPTFCAGQTGPKEVVESWMNSEGHRANILSTQFTKLGVGFCKVSSGYNQYWVQLFSD